MVRRCCRSELPVVSPSESQQPAEQRGVESQQDWFEDELLGDDCVECWAEVDEKHSDMWVFGLQVTEGWVESTGDSIVSQAVGLICKLVGVQFGRQDRFKVMRDEPIEALHDDGSDCDRPVVVVASLRLGWLWWLWGTSGQQLGSKRCWRCSWRHLWAPQNTLSGHNQEYSWVKLSFAHAALNEKHVGGGEEVTEDYYFCTIWWEQAVLPLPTALFDSLNNTAITLTAVKRLIFVTTASFLITIYCTKCFKLLLLLPCWGEATHQRTVGIPMFIRILLIQILMKSIVFRDTVPSSGF